MKSLDVNHAQAHSKEKSNPTDHKSKGPFVILLSNKQDEDEVAYECRRKGFLVSASMKTKVGRAFLLSLSQKLVVKLAIELNLQVELFHDYSSLEKLKLTSASIAIIDRAKVLDVEEVWISHDKAMLSEIDNSKGDAQLENIKEYYGSKIAMYFGWLDFFTHILAVPSIAGILLFMHQIYLQNVDSAWIPFFCVLISLWSTYFLEFWKRRGSELSFMWKVFGVEDIDAENDLAQGAKKSDDGVALRQMLSFVTVLSLMYVMVCVMLYFKNMQLNATQIYGTDSYFKYYPTLLYSALPAAATAVFEPIAERLNKFEGHTTKTGAENSRILKIFALEFVNRYCALFHAAFWLKDLGVLRSLLISLLTFNAVLNNAMEIGIPILKSYYNRWSNRAKAKRDAAKGLDKKSSSERMNSDSSAFNDVTKAEESANGNTRNEHDVHSYAQTQQINNSSCHGSAELMEILEQEVSKTDYDLHTDYLEIVIQYGYVTMFVVAFPLAPALALLNNLFEGHVDLYKLTECRRPALNQRSNIGSWQYCMEFISFLSVITNCYLIVMVSTHFEMIVPADLEPYVRTETGRLIAMMLMEHLLLGFKVMMMYIIDDVPRWIREAIAQRHAQEREASAKARLHKYVASGGEESAIASSPPAKLSLRDKMGKRVIQASSSFREIPEPSPRQGDHEDDQSYITKQKKSKMSLFSRFSFSASHHNGHTETHSTNVRIEKSPSAVETEINEIYEELDGSMHANKKLLQRTPTNSIHGLNSMDFTRGSSQQLQNQESVIEDAHSHTAQSAMTPNDRLVKETASPYGFDPAHMMILICLPALLHYLQVTPWLYIPLAVLFFGYLQTKKDRIDRKIAMGIVSDPTLLKLILEEMPSWPTDSEFQQMEWVNFMLQKFWPMLAIVGEEKAVRIGQAILTRMKPSFLSELTIKRFSFGTIAPRFLGIRMHQTKDEEGVVRCDLEMRYAGDPQIIIQVGPTEVEILNLRISCMLRCELLEFTPKTTPFKLASATMMKKPFVDFNIKVAGMDIMGTKAMTNLVHGLFHKVLQGVIKYPKKIFVPMGAHDDSIDIEALKALTPVGIIYLTLEKGTDLIQANVFGQSDPYVEIETTDQEIQSEIHYNTVNPEWNETHDIIVYDRGSQVISFTVMDFEMTNHHHRCLGKAEFEVNKLPYNTRVQKMMQLKGVDKGSITVTCVYIPLTAARASNQTVSQRKARLPKSVFKGESSVLDDDDEGEKDVLFDLPMEELQSDEKLISGDLAMQSPEEELDATTLAQAGLGILMISKIKLRQLKSGVGGNWKPCVSFHLGNTKKQTHSKKNMVNPEFDEHFAIVVKDQHMMERIMVRVLDKNKIMSASRQVGEVSVPLFDLLNAKVAGPFGAIIEKEYEVESEVVECMVGFKLQWFSTATRN